MNTIAYPILITSLSFVLASILLRNKEDMKENDRMLYAVLFSTIVGLGSLAACKLVK
jgi:hypothetical protein